MSHDTSEAQSSETYFNHTMTCLRAGNEPEALAAFIRVLQLTPDNELARSWREKLAARLGLAELDQAARAMEQFAYSQCGPGYGWKVELREIYKFQPGQSPETVDAVLLDLCQTPQAFVQLVVTAGEYTVSVMVERPITGVSHLAISEVSTETIPAQPAQLLEVLNHMLATGTLVKDGDQLRYNVK